MLTALIGKKLGMSQLFTGTGSAIPVTIIEAGPCVVTQIKTVARDGYEAVQVGYGEKRHATRAELGHLGHALPLTALQRKKQQKEQAEARSKARKGKAEEQEEAEASTSAAPESKKTSAKQRKAYPGGGLGPFSVVKEVEILPEHRDSVQIGQQVNADMFRIGEVVDIVGTSKGKGFQGVMKRHGFRGGQRTHGQSDRMRAPGSIGPGTTPGRVLKGTRMAGRTGNDRVTIKGLEIVQSDPERNILIVKGSVPGPRGGIVLIRKVAGSSTLAEKLPEVQVLE